MPMVIIKAGWVVKRSYVMLSFIGAASLFGTPSSLAETYPPDVQAKLEACLHVRDASQIASAISACTELLNQASWDADNRARIYMSRGNAFDGSGNATKAIADYDQAIALSPHVALFYYNRGFCYLRLKDEVRAKADFEQAVAVDPNFSYGHYYLGFLALHRKDFNDAIAHFDRAIALNPKMALAYLYRGTAYGKLGNGDKAVADLKDAIKIDPSLAKSIQVDGKLMN